MKNKTKIVIGVIPVLIVVCIGLFLIFNRHVDDQRTMKEYKADAISEIRNLSKDKKWIQEQVDILKKGEGPYGNWFSKRVIPFKDGDWIIYIHRDSKGDRPRKQMIKTEKGTYNIFIGLGSNGKWYYSTYHFCVDMLALMMCDQLEDIKSFVTDEGFYIEEFDGQSSNCEKGTWNTNQ